MWTQGDMWTGGLGHFQWETFVVSSYLHCCDLTIPADSKTASAARFVTHGREKQCASQVKEMFKTSSKSKWRKVIEHHFLKRGEWAAAPCHGLALTEWKSPIFMRKLWRQCPAKRSFVCEHSKIILFFQNPFMLVKEIHCDHVRICGAVQTSL